MTYEAALEDMLPTTALELGHIVIVDNEAYAVLGVDTPAPGTYVWTVDLRNGDGIEATIEVADVRERRWYVIGWPDSDNFND